MSLNASEILPASPSSSVDSRAEKSPPRTACTACNRFRKYFWLPFRSPSPAWISALFDFSVAIPGSLSSIWPAFLAKVLRTQLGALSRAKASSLSHNFGQNVGDAGARAHAPGRPMQSCEADGSTSPRRQRSCCNHREDKRPARPAPFALRCCETTNALDLGRVPWAKKKNRAERYVLETHRLAVRDDPATLLGHDCIRDGSSLQQTRQRPRKIAAPNRSGRQQTIPIISVSLFR